MRKHTAMTSLRRSSALFQAAVLVTAAFVPAVMLNGSASGAQLGDRFIDMSATQTSEGSGRDTTDNDGAGPDAASFGDDVTYTVSFELTTAHGDLEGIVVDFCDASPIVGDACVAPTGFNTNFATLGSTLAADDDLNANWAVDTTNSTANTVILTDAITTGDTLGAATVVEFDLGTAAAADGFTNPSAAGAFYARIVTFTDDTVAAAYDSATVNVNNPGASTDEGGIALSVANELTITARVQEVLEFCIGTDTVSTGLTNTAADDCTDVGGTDLTLDVVGGSIATTSTIDTPNDGIALIRTNALNGASVYYKAEQDTASGKLKQTGATCSGTSLADACFNSVGTTRTPITAGVENFGMALKDLNTTSGGATTALSCDGDYEGNGTDCTGAVAGNNYAWDDSGAFDTIATSSGPIDDEKVSIEFAATASPTTPTGLYTVTANFVATSTF